MQVSRYTNTCKIWTSHEPMLLASEVLMALAYLHDEPGPLNATIITMISLQ